MQKINYQEKSRKICRKSYFTKRLKEPEYETKCGWGLATPPGRAGWAWPRLGGGLAALDTPSVSLFAYKLPSDLKTQGSSTFFHKEFRSTATTRFHDSEPETPFWHPAGTGNWRRSSSSSSPSLLHRPSMFPPSMSE